MKQKITFTALLLLLISFSTAAQEVQSFKTKLTGPANLNYRKAPKRVVVSDFQVNYQTALSLEDKKKGGKMWRGGLKGDAKASLSLILKGLDLDALQKLTDQLYEEYINDLKAQGYEIAPIEEVWDHKLYKAKRDKRWELKSGNGPERSDQYGILITRPSTQQFVVSQKEFDKSQAGIMKLADYEEATERKISTQKNDFIFNKVIVMVNAFEDAQGEGSKALGRLAGTAQVKAETNFSISSQSKVNYNFGQVIPRGAIEVAGVIEKQKFDAFQRADIDKMGTEYGDIMTVWEVEHKADAEFITVKCDPEMFVKGAWLGVNAFLKSAIEELVGKS